MIPPFELSTAVARAVLPDTLSRSDAVFNLGRAALVALAFEKRDLALLGAACEDRIHQPYRKLLIPGWNEVTEAVAEAGAKAVWLSGAGPTILAVTSQETAPGFAHALAPVLASRPEGKWVLETLSADPCGVTLYR
jgi:homoserine kinase